MDEATRKALESVVEYLYLDEKKDYETYDEKPADHIFRAVQTLNQFLAGKDQTTKQIESLIKNAKSECLRANRDTLKEFGIKTVKQLEDKFESGVETNDDWDDILWHEGYVRGLSEALCVIHQNPTKQGFNDTDKHLHS